MRRKVGWLSSGKSSPSFLTHFTIGKKFLSLLGNYKFAPLSLTQLSERKNVESRKKKLHNLLSRNGDEYKIIMCSGKSTRHKSFRANFMINYAHMSGSTECRGEG